MQDVGAGWLMTSLSSSPSLVALVEAADSIPVMLLALPAGALADIVDRRRLLIVVQVYLLIVAGALGVLTLLDLTTAWVLLGFIFALGVGTAMMMPAWAAIVPDLVPPGRAAVGDRAEQHRDQRVARDRARRSPASWWPPSARGSSSSLNALSYIGILAVLLRWRREHRKSTLPAERFLSAIRVGMRFVMHTRALQVVLIRGVAFFVFASATWSLFPLIVRRELGRGPEIYGLLLTCIGVGAVARRHAAAARAREASRATRWSPARACSTRSPRSRSRIVQNIGAPGGGDARDRRRVDLDPLGAAGRRRR